MTAEHGHHRVILEVDDRGRVSLGKLGFRSMQLVAELTSDGGLMLHPAVAITSAELAHYQNPDAVRRLDEAIASANEGRLTTLRLRSDSPD